MIAIQGSIEVYPSRSDIDVIRLYRDDGPQQRAWKADGRKDGALCAPDIWYEEFDGFLRHCSEYIDDDARWVSPKTGGQISVWTAIKLLLADRPERV